MKTRDAGKLLLALACTLSLCSCGGDPEIPFGQKISGTLTDKSHYWVDYDPDTHAATDAGYSADYNVQVTAGRSYTVTFWTSTGRGQFEDKDGGRFHYSNGVVGTSVGPEFTNPETVTWIPAKTGSVAVDVYAFTSDVPLDYWVEITQ